MMKAVIIIVGLGSRLHPITNDEKMYGASEWN